MSAQTDKVVRRRRKGRTRRVPSSLQQAQRKPLAFGWGSHLNRWERESIKERIALLSGIGLAALLVLLLGWGWYQDNVARPASVAAENNKPVAQVGSHVLTMGWFKKYENFRKRQIDTNLAQYSSQVAQLRASKKDPGQLAQLQQQIGLLNQQKSNLAADTLTGLIDREVLKQRASTLGVTVTAKRAKSLLKKQQIRASGPRHFEAFVKQSGLSMADIKGLIIADDLQNRVSKTLADRVARTQDKVRASHILVKQKSVAEKLYKQVQHGASIAILAKVYSIDKGTKQKGGDLGYFAHGGMVGPFDKAAFSMHPGQAAVVHTQYGWHVLKVTNRRRIRLTAQEYQQQQQNAYTSWLTKERAILHVQRFIKPENLPGAKQPAPTTQLPGQVPGQSPGQSQKLPIYRPPPKGKGKAKAKAKGH